jgi:hypothetical protein
MADFPQHLMIVFFHKKMVILSCIYHKRHQMITIQLKIVIFIEKRLSLNVEENQPMTSMCYF